MLKIDVANMGGPYTVVITSGIFLVASQLLTVMHLLHGMLPQCLWFRNESMYEATTRNCWAVEPGSYMQWLAT